MDSPHVSENPVTSSTEHSTHAFEETLDSCIKTMQDNAYVIGAGMAATAALCLLSKKYVPAILFGAAAITSTGTGLYRDFHKNTSDNNHNNNNNNNNNAGADQGSTNNTARPPVVDNSQQQQRQLPSNDATNTAATPRQMLDPVVFAGNGGLGFVSIDRQSTNPGQRTYDAGQGQPSGQGNGQGPLPSDVPVLHGNPNQQHAEYPGGIGPDANQVGSIMRQAGPQANFMYQLFIHTYNSRANENWLPANLALREISPEAKNQIAQWHLKSDLDIYGREPSLGNRDLKPRSDMPDTPGSAKNPGHMYAFGMDKNGLPVDVLEYYRDKQGNIDYYGQYLISYNKDKQGDTVVDVSDYAASNQTQAYGPSRNIAGINHTLMGVTRYYESANNTVLRAERYSATNLERPLYAVNFDNNHRSAGTLAPQFYFFDLFGT
ncbi:MAG TPA: hypothetical protein V6C81_12080 [Planktothrix sp.]|jgi:hypothetical protein